MSRALWIDPSFGASGDMMLGALSAVAVQLGVDDALDELIDVLGSLTDGGFSVSRSTVTRAGIAAARVAVDAPAGPARHWSDIDRSLADAPIPEPVRTGARRTFRMLGEIEAAQHSIDIDDVHFHEVGAADAIVDIVGAWWLLDRLGVDDVTCGPVGLGHGTVAAAHGRLPIPAPATAALLTGAPVRALDVELETCTPTGAALLATMGTWGPIPSGSILAVGRGAGTKDLVAHPNVVTAILLERSDQATGEPAVVLSTNVDDVTPEVLGHVVDRLLAAGADDVWILPALMKKNRPGHEIDVLCAPDRAPALREMLSAETGTLGVRTTSVTKFPAERRWETIDVRGGAVRIKIGPHTAKPEHDDLVALSERTGVPVRQLADEARREWDRDRG